MKDCCFCEEYNNSNDGVFFNLIGNKIGCRSRVLMDSKNWYAIPTLGSLTVGYVLLVCKHHYLSLANMDWDLISEMLKLKENIENIIYSKLSLRCVSFEHGSTLGTVGANSVDHVHVHVVPMQNKIWNDIVAENSIVNFQQMTDYLDLFKLWKKDTPDSYLLFQDLDKGIYYINDAAKYDSQFFRKCISSFLNVAAWDWKQEIHLNNILKTLKLFGVISNVNLIV